MKCRAVAAAIVAGRMVFETESVHLPHNDYSYVVQMNWSGNNNNVMEHANPIRSARNSTV